MQKNKNVIDGKIQLLHLFHSVSRIEKVKSLLLFSIFILMSFGQFAKVSLVDFVVGIYLFDIFICLYLFVFLLAKYKNLSSKITTRFSEYRQQALAVSYAYASRTPAEVAAHIHAPIGVGGFKRYSNRALKYYIISFSFVVWAVFVTTISFQYLDNPLKYLISVSYLLRFCFYSLFGFCVFIDLKKYTKLRQKIKIYLIINFLLVSIFGFIQLAMFNDFSKLDSSLLWDPHKNRLAGSFFDPNFTGALLVILLTYIFFLFIKSKKNKHILFVILLIGFLAILLTFSRSAWLMLAIVVFVLGLFKYRYLLVFSVIVAFSAYYFVPRVQTRLTSVTDQSDSFHFRILSWSEAIEVSNKKLLSGWGFNTYRYVKQDLGYTSYEAPLGNRSGAGSDSSILQIMVNTGIIGVSIFLFAYLYLIFDLFTSFRSEKSLFGLFLMSIVIGLLVNAQFINSMLYPNILITMNVLIGIFYNASEISRP